MIEFSVRGTPVPQGSKRCLKNGRVIEANPVALHDWRDAISAAAVSAVVEHGDWDLFGAFAVDLLFLFDWPRSAYNKAGTLRQTRQWDLKTSRPDIDKLARAALDALTVGGVWHDDAQVIRLEARKAYHALAGAYITIEKVEE